MRHNNLAQSKPGSKLKIFSFKLSRYSYDYMDDIISNWIEEETPSIFSTHFEIDRDDAIFVIYYNVSSAIGDVKKELAKISQNTLKDKIKNTITDDYVETVDPDMNENKVTEDIIIGDIDTSPSAI